MNPNAVTDFAVGGAAITTPLWLPTVSGALNLFTAAAGAVLVVVRLYLMWRDRNRRGRRW